MEVIILLGSPGAGKGSLAEEIREQTPFRHVSTGDMLRSAIKTGTRTGREAEGYMKRGELVPDEVIIRLVEERMESGSPDEKYMLDGVPRTETQAELLAASVEARGGNITHVFLLDAPCEVLMTRLTGRRVCRNCGMNYHVTNVPPKREGVCDECGGELYHRPDDQKETIANRLEVFEAQTRPLIARYEAQGLLARIDSNRPAKEMMVDVEAILARG